MQLGVGNDPLSSGSVTIASGSSTVHFDVKGTRPNIIYSATFCRNGGGSSCVAMGGLTTDASGNGSADFSLATTVGAGTGQSGVFFLTSGKPPAIEFITGFKAP